MTRETIIFGQGFCADEIRRRLDAFGCPVATAIARRDTQNGDQRAPEPEAQEHFVYDRLLACSGSCGDLTLLASVGGKIVRRKAAAVILTGEGNQKPDFAAYGLSDGDAVMSLGELRSLSGSAEKVAAKLEGVKRVAFLTGVAREKVPAVCEEVMRMAMRLQSENGVQTFIYTRNLKVAAWGLEALYRETRMAGVVYIKLSQPMPEITIEDGRPVITCQDDISHETFRLRPDLTVVDESLMPPAGLDELAAVFQIQRDEQGFAQGDNVHRLTVDTNRHGILAAGPVRSALVAGRHDQRLDAANAAVTVVGRVLGKKVVAENAAEIDTGQCVRCLTCYRLCPYRAVVLRDEQPVVDPLVCERCGICAAECPALAIRLPGFERSRIGDDIAQGRSADPQAEVPFIVAFCCGRSAAPAARLASMMGRRLPARLKIIEVPCAGSISREFILEAFTRGADGVMVLTCHTGNCHSEKGNRHARSRAAEIRSLLPLVGIDKERLTTATLASNMGAEFARLVDTFAAELEKRETRTDSAVGSETA